MQLCLGLQPKNSVEYSDEVTLSHIHTQCWGCVCIHHAFILYCSVGAHSIRSLTLVLQLIKIIEVGSLFYFFVIFRKYEKHWADVPTGGPEGQSRGERHKREDFVWNIESPFALRRLRQRKHKFVAMSLSWSVCRCKIKWSFSSWLCAFFVLWLCSYKR